MQDRFDDPVLREPARRPSLREVLCNSIVAALADGPRRVACPPRGDLNRLTEILGKIMTNQLPVWRTLEVI